MKRPLNASLIWLVALFISAVVATISFIYLDLPIARWFLQNPGQLSYLGGGLGSAVLLSIEAAIALTLVGTRLIRGHLSRLGVTLALASLTSMCAYAVSDGVLKLFCGVPNPSDVLLGGAHHAFHFLAGSQRSSFPSGHMVLAGSFAGAFMNLNRSSVWFLSSLLLLGATVLIVGEWHFASDVIIGVFAGVSAGVLAGELWQAHSK